MESFKFLYLEACENLKISRCEKLLTKVEDAGNSSSLNLSGVQFSNSTCTTFGQALTKDVHIRELDCSNCMFSDEGLLSILLGLEKNKFLVTLNLKGNNIRSWGTEAIGKFVRHNSHLQNLYLEWNGLGIFPEKFALFCESLCANSSLKLLDLRNNQLNHVCARFLSDVILKNSSLQELDLRWNNIGLTGGRVILKSLARNRTILSLQTSGNDLPSDLQEAIEIATSASAQRYIANNEQISREKYLATKLQDKEQERNEQVKSLLEQLEKTDKNALTKERWNLNKLSQAEEALAEKDKICESLTMKIRELESELWTLSVEKSNLAFSVNAQETKNKEQNEKHQSRLSKEKEDKEKTERDFLEQIGSIKQDNLSLKQQIQDLKILKVQSEEQNSKLKESLTKLEKKSKQEQTSLKDQIAVLNERHTEDMKEKEMMHKQEISRSLEEISEVEKSLKQKLSVLESKKNDFEAELKKKNSQIFADRSQAELALVQLEKKLKSDHEIIRQQLEERIEMLEDSNKEQYDHLQEDLQVMHKLRTDITSLDLNLAEQDHEIEHLKKLLEEKNAEMKANETKIRLEVKEQLQELSKAKKTIQKHIHENKLLQESISEMVTRHKEELDAKDKIIQNLKMDSQLHQQKIKEILEEEKNRTLQLQKAFGEYLKSGVQNENTFNSGDMPRGGAKG